MSAQERHRIWSEIAKIETCVMVTMDAGMLRGRPMVGTVDEEEDAIWFVANRQDHKDDEILADDRVCLTYADPAKNIYVSVSGAGEVVRDLVKLKELWTASIDAWFEEGPEDRNAILIKFTPRAAEYWDAPNSDILAALETLTTGIADQRPHLGENRKVSM